MLHSENYNKHKFNLLFLGIVLVQVITWLIMKPVWAFSDDYCYALNASNLFLQKFQLTNNEFQNRLGVSFPAAIIFYFLKITPYTISLFPLLISILTTKIVFAFSKKTNQISLGIISCFLIATNILQITYSNVLFPDILISCYSIAIVLLLFQGRKQNSKSWKKPLLIGLFTFIGIFTKETIVLIFPFVLLIMGFDLIKKQNLLFWKYLIYSGIIFILLFFAFYYFITGDALFRIKNLIAYNSTGLSNKEMTDFLDLKYGSNILQWMNQQLGYVFIIILSLPIFYKFLKKKTSTFISYISVFALSLLIIYSILFFIPKYGMLFKMERVWMLLISPLSILSAHSILELNKKIILFFIIIFTILGFYNYEIVGMNRAVLFFSFSFVNILLYFDLLKFRYKNLLLLIPFVLLTINFLYANNNYRKTVVLSSDIVKNELEKLNTTNQQKIILTDEEFKENHIIYNQFKEYENLKILSFEKLDSLRKLNTNYYLLFNQDYFNQIDSLTNKNNYDTVLYNSKGLLILKSK